MSSPRKTQVAPSIKLMPPIQDPYVALLLQKISEGKRVLDVSAGETIYVQGDRADAIFFIQAGKVKISVVSSAGKEGVLVMLGPRNFLGEGCLIGQCLRIS